MAVIGMKTKKMDVNFGVHHWVPMKIVVFVEEEEQDIQTLQPLVKTLQTDFQLIPF